MEIVLKSFFVVILSEFEKTHINPFQLIKLLFFSQHFSPHRQPAALIQPIHRNVPMASNLIRLRAAAFVHRTAQMYAAWLHTRGT